MDKMTEDAYAYSKTTGKHVRIANTGGFKQKMDEATAAVLKMISGI